MKNSSTCNVNKIIQRYAFVMLEKINVYRCNICSTTFMDEFVYENHILTHIPDAYVKVKKQIIFQCKICTAGFLNRDDFNLHRVHHIVKKVRNRNYKKIVDEQHYNVNIGRNKKCSELGQKVALESTLHEHSVTIKTSQAKPKKRKLKEKENVHKKKQVAKKMPFIPCTLCNQKLRIDCMANHILLHSEPKHKCDRCGKLFHSPPSLCNHINNVHLRKSQFPCPYCKKIFFYKTHLDNHERIHRGEKPFVCKFCDKSFSDRSAHLRHERIHTKDYKYFCYICDKAYTDKSALIGHNKRHHTKRSCDICDQIFCTSRDLKLHLLTHFGVTPVKCSSCDLLFKSKGSLKSHINKVHSKKKKMASNR